LGELIKLTQIFQSPLFPPIREYLVKPSEKNNITIHLFVPFIKTTVLEKLIEGIENKITIITTWEPNDLLSGSSELKL